MTWALSATGPSFGLVALLGAVRLVGDQRCDCVAGRAKLHLDAGELPYDALVARPLSNAFCLVATAVAGLTIRTVVAMIAVAVRPPVEPSIVTTRGARPQRAVSSLI